MLRIAHVTSFFDPEYYGSHEYFLSLELQRLGNDITVITSDLHSLWGGALGLRGKFKCGCHDYDGLRVYRIRSLGRISITPIAHGVLAVLRRGGYDVILTHELFHFFSFCSAAAAKNLRKPLLLFLHDYSGGRRPVYKLLFKLNYITLGTFVLQQADRVVALSDAAAAFAQQLGKTPAVVDIIPTGVDLNLFRGCANRTSNKEEKVILFVGRLTKEKGVFFLLSVFRDIVDAARNVRLLIVGTGPEELSARRICTDLHIDDKVYFLGRVNNKSMPTVYEKADMLVLPTLTSEPFGNVLLEAMASGIPVIGSAIGGMRDIIVDGENGFKFVPGNAAQLKTRMLTLLRNENLRMNMGWKARSWVEKRFSWRIVGSRVDTIIKAMC